MPPLGPIIWCVISFLLFRKFLKTRRILLIVGACALYLSCTPICSYLIGIPLIPEPNYHSSDKIKDAEAIVILGAGTRRNAIEYGGGNTVPIEAIARIRYGAYLSRKTEIPILVTGGVTSPPISEAEAMNNYLSEELMLPARWIESNSLNTRENAQMSMDMLKSDGIDTIVLVTSSYHMTRASLEFENVGFSVITAPTYTRERGAISIWSFLPSASGMIKMNRYLHEWAGIALYHLR